MRRIFQALFLAIVLLVPVLGAHAQLVTVDKKYTIKSVDPGHNRIAVKYLDAANEPVKEQLLVDIDGNTQVFINGRQMAWTSLQPNMEIEVKGGLEAGLDVHAKTILVLRNHVPSPGE